MDTLDLKHFIAKVPSMEKKFQGVFTTNELVKLRGNIAQKPAIIIYTKAMQNKFLGSWANFFSKNTRDEVFYFYFLFFTHET